MKYYQCRNERKLLYTLISIITIVNGAVATIMFVDVDFVSGTKHERLFGGIMFALIAMIGLVSYVYMKIVKKFERTVEVAEDGITYREKNRVVIMEWENMGKVLLFPLMLWQPWNRIVFFVVKGATSCGQKTKVTNEQIWCEYNDEMLEEIKKHWHGRIENEKLYLRYKNRKSIK